MERKGVLVLCGLLFMAAVVALMGGRSLRAGEEEIARVSEVEKRSVENGLNGVNYQGYIEKDGEPYTGACDFRFTIVGSPSNTKTYTSVNVQEGHFTVVLEGQWIDSWNGLYSLQVDAACPSGGALTSLSLPQPVTTVPFARALAPGTVLLSPTYGGCALMSKNVRTDAQVIVGCNPQGLREGEPPPAAADAGALISIGGEGIESNTPVIHGMEVTGAGVGLIVNGGTTGFKVEYNLGIGGIIRGTGRDGLFIDNPGRHGITVFDPAKRGLEVIHANEIGVTVFDPVDRGIYIEDSGASGISIYRAGNQGIYVEGSTNYDGSFQDNIFVGGACSGCALANFAVNVGGALEPGTPVTVVGVEPSSFREAPVLLQVRPAATGEVVIGIVAGAAEAVAAMERQESIAGDVTAGAQEEVADEISLIPREGPVAPGGYLTIIRDGLARVKVASEPDAILPGTHLAVADGVAIGFAEATADRGTMPSSIGIAVSAPDADGYVWALITLR